MTITPRGLALLALVLPCAAALAAPPMPHTGILPTSHTRILPSLATDPEPMPALVGASSIAQTPLTVQVINDSGLPDSEVMLLLAGKEVQVKDESTGITTTYPFAVSGVPSIDITRTPPTAISAGPLQCPTSGPASCVGLTVAPFKVDSPYSGARGLPVYTFNMSTVGSGTLFVSYAVPGVPTLSTPPAPTVTAPFRFQSVEFSYSNAIVSNGDLTTIDFYGIPLQLQTYAPDDTTYQHPLDRVTYYTSTPTLLQSFLTASPELRYAFRGTNGSRYHFSPENAPFTNTQFTNFARIVGPNQAASAWSATSPVFYPATAPGGWSGTWPPVGSAGSPWPYPSFSSYLAQLASGGYTFNEIDNRAISAYTFNYTGKVLPMTTGTTDTCLPASLAAPGYYIKLTGTTSGAAPLPDNADICIPLPTRGAAATYNSDGTTQLTPPVSSGDFVIYGAVQNCEALVLYSADGNNGNSIGVQACADSNAAQLGALANSIYGWIQADVLAALNFGYMQGQADATYFNGAQGQSSVWYGLPPTQYPFGAARAPLPDNGNDGLYNPWAALIYNNSDAYGFAFSDRKGRPSPDISFPIGGTLRLWILPDVRLDAPLAQVVATGQHSVTLAWPRVANAGHYVVTYGPATARKTQRVRQPAAGIDTIAARVSGLASGSPYNFTVRTIGRTGTRQSTDMSVQATTKGVQPKAAAGNLKFNFSLNWTPPGFLGATPELWIGGTQALYSVTNGSGSYAATDLPITVGPPASSAPLNVVPAAGTATAPYLTATLDAPVIAPGGIANLTVTLNNPTSDPISMNMGYSVALPPSVTGTLPTTPAPGSCPGAVIVDNVVQLGSTPLAAGTSCFVGVGLTSATPGTVLIVAPDWTTAPATGAPVVEATAVDVPLTVTGGSVTPAQTITPTNVTAGGTTVLTMTFANATGAPLTLLEPWFDELPVGVTGAPPQGGPTACAGAAIDVTATILSLPKGATIPPGGCSIVSTLTASVVGSFTNTAGPLITNATPVPTQVYPVVLRMPSTAGIQPDAVLWSGNLYLTFLGAPLGYSVGPCQPTDECRGATPTPADPVPYSTRLVPNYLEHQDTAAGLSIAGGVLPIGAPFEAGTPAAIGVSFTPVADKRFATVVVPAR